MRYLLLLLFLLASPLSAAAQAKLPGIPAPSTEPGDAAVEPDVDALVRTLEDPEARADFIAKLKALEGVPKPAPSQPEQLIDRIGAEIGERQRVALRTLRDVAGSYERLPDLWRWLRLELGDGYRRGLWLESTLWLVLVVSLGVVARAVVIRWWRPPEDVTPRVAALHRFARAFTAAGAFIAVAYAVLYFGDPPWLAAQAGLDYTLGLTSCFVVLPLLDLLVGEWREARLLPISDEVAEPLLYGGLKRALILGIMGYFVLEAARAAGLPWTLHGFLSRVLYLIVTLRLIVVVLRLRGPVGRTISAFGSQEHMLTRALPWQIMARLWSPVVIALIALHYLVWALQVPGGFGFLFRATLLTVLILIGARLLAYVVDRALSPRAGEAVEDEAEPGPASGAVLAPLRLLSRLLIVAFAVILVLSVWQTGLLRWLDDVAGLALLPFLGEIALVLFLTVAAVQVTANRFNAYLAATDTEGKPTHSNRARTFASLFKNAIIVVVIGTAALVILSRLGVNAGALLAGAGVVGLAIGFGSQKLVQDLITGLFILLGDVARVGDVVEVAGRSGVIEAISLRSLQLRGYDGNVHVVPHSSIDVVTNMTKDFSFAVLRIGVAYREDVDEVMTILRDIDAELRREWPYRRHILAPLDVAGVDAFADSAVTVVARSKVRPGEQWGVRRAFLRKIKHAFDAKGIEIPFPHTTVWFGEGKDGAAPPLRLEERARRLRQEEGPDEDEDEEAFVLEPTVSTPRRRDPKGTPA